jgi:hypothetical protein
MKTVNEVRAEINRVIESYGYKNIVFVITESKLSKNARKTWFGFRAMVNEEFNTDWQQYEDRSFFRMIETISC